MTEAGERVVYKPVAGIEPLWDFAAPSLVTREVWTYRIDQTLGTGVVPETAYGTGIYGPGAVQRFVEALADSAVVEMVNRADVRLWPIALLDLVTNNADRKAGHILRNDGDRLWAIDHGLTFHSEPKLRTILWGLAGQPIPNDLLLGLHRLRDAIDGELGSAFESELSGDERSALIDRVERLLDDKIHPQPPEHRPAIPWPPY